MITLISTFFRTKIRFVLSLIIFTTLTLILVCFLENYNNTITKIDKIKEKEENRKIVVLLENNITVDDIVKIDYVQSVELRGNLNSSTYATIVVEKENNLGNVMSKLKSLGMNPSILSDDTDIELNRNKTLESFYGTMIIIVIITFIIIIFTEIKLLLMWDEKNIKFLKVMGYQNHTICIITLSKIYMLILISIILSSILLILFHVFFHFPFNFSTILFLVATLIIMNFLQIPFLLRKIRMFDYDNNL